MVISVEQNEKKKKEKKEENINLNGKYDELFQLKVLQQLLQKQLVEALDKNKNKKFTKLFKEGIDIERLDDIEYLEEMYLKLMSQTVDNQNDTDKK